MSTRSIFVENNTNMNMYQFNISINECLSLFSSLLNVHLRRHELLFSRKNFCKSLHLALSMLRQTKNWKIKCWNSSWKNIKIIFWLSFIWGFMFSNNQNSLIACIISLLISKKRVMLILGFIRIGISSNTKLLSGYSYPTPKVI